MENTTNATVIPEALANGVYGFNKGLGQVPKIKQKEVCKRLMEVLGQKTRQGLRNWAKGVYAPSPTQIIAITEILSDPEIFDGKHRITEIWGNEE